MIPFRLLAWVLGVALLPGAAAGQTVVTGTVVLPKAPPLPVVNKRYTILTKAGILSPYPPVAIVYLEGSFPAPATLPRLQMAQKDLEFAPALLAVQVGTRVEFPNFDQVYHNVFSYSAAKRFDLGRYRANEQPVPSVLFDTPGLVTVRCDIHEHMRALILVLATPYFTLTDSQGHYRLEGLPAGSYVLKAWVDSRTTLEHPVTLTAGAPATADFP